MLTDNERRLTKSELEIVVGLISLPAVGREAARAATSITSAGGVIMAPGPRCSMPVTMTGER